MRYSHNSVIIYGDIHESRKRGVSFMVNELLLIDNIDILFQNKIVLYGAGQYGKMVYNNLRNAGVKIAYFCDSSSEKWGKSIEDVEVITPKKLKALDEKEKITIIISVERVSIIDQIIDLFKVLELKTDYIFTWFGLEVAMLYNIKLMPVSDDYRAFLLQSNELNYLIDDHSVKRNFLKSALSCMENINSVLVYQPGKVGSRTVFTSISQAGVLCRHVHFLGDLYYVECLNQSEAYTFVKTYQELVKKAKRIKVITLVREPISRDYSSWFQQINSVSYRLFSPGDRFAESISKVVKESSISCSNNTNYGDQFDWFDRELKAVFGVDIFNYPFDKGKGYSLIKQGNIEILVIKLEKLNNLEQVIGKYVGAPGFKLISANEANDKIYKYLYKNVLDSIKIPPELVTLYYENNPRMDHFYTQKEKAAFLKKWKKNIESEGIINND